MILKSENADTKLRSGGFQKVREGKFVRSLRYIATIAMPFITQC